MPGLSADELFAFVIYPKSIDFAFERTTRPRDLYAFFRGYYAARPETRTRQSAALLEEDLKIKGKFNAEHG